jgi:archaellin
MVGKMRRFPAAAAAAVLFAFSGFLAASPSTTPTPAVRAKAHGVAVAGRVTRVDSAKKTFFVREAGGKEVALSWTAATTIAGGELKTGYSVTLRYLDKDARHIATYIRVNAPASAAPASTAPPAASAAATPNR